MSDQKKLIVDGNAFYELDMECINRKRNHREGGKEDKNPKGTASPQKSMPHGGMEN